MSQPARKHDDALEPLTPEQRAAVEAWKAAGCPEQPEVAALRKKARGEPLTDAEQALLDRAGRKPSGPGIPHARIEEMLAERERRERG